MAAMVPMSPPGADAPETSAMTAPQTPEANASKGADLSGAEQPPAPMSTAPREAQANNASSAEKRSAQLETSWPILGAEPGIEVIRPAARTAGWHVVQEGRTIEDLQHELEVESKRERSCAETQTEMNPEEVPEDCIDRWFAGFTLPIPLAGPGKLPKGSSPPPSPAPVDPEVEGTCRPERQIRRPAAGSRSRSRDGSVASRASRRSSSASSSASSGSSSSSSDGKRQRVTSSEEEGPGGPNAAGPVAGTAATGMSSGTTPDSAAMSGPRMRPVDYSDLC